MFILSVDEVTSGYCVGSADWSWNEEARDLDQHPCPCCGERGHYQKSLEADIALNGIRHPVLLGDDGRVWDGHHRIAAAMRLRCPVPVKFASPALPFPDDVR